MSIKTFTGKAEAYVKGRPGYPKSAIELILNEAKEDSVFADIGAGTGKFTEELAKSGHSIFAVEPNHDMRKQLENILQPYEKAKAINGSAETTTLADNSVDIITIAHALHWFDLESFRNECDRIIKPGGLIVVIYNHIPSRKDQDLYKETVDKFFTNKVSSEFTNKMQYTREKWHAYIASQEGNPVVGDLGYDKHIAAINAGFDKDSVDNLVQLDRTTIVYSQRQEG